MAPTILSRLTELRHKLGGLLKEPSELTKDPQKNLLGTDKPIKPMEDHDVTFEVIEQETHIPTYMRTHQGFEKVMDMISKGDFKPRPPVWKYTCKLIDGPYAGRHMWIFRKKGLHEFVVGNKYAGKVRTVPHPFNDEKLPEERMFFNELSIRKNI